MAVFPSFSPTLSVCVAAETEQEVTGGTGGASTATGSGTFQVTASGHHNGELEIEKVGNGNAESYGGNANIRGDVTLESSTPITPHRDLQHETTNPTYNLLPVTHRRCRLVDERLVYVRLQKITNLE